MFFVVGPKSNIIINQHWEHDTISYLVYKACVSHQVKCTHFTPFQTYLPHHVEHARCTLSTCMLHQKTVEMIINKSWEYDVTQQHGSCNQQIQTHRKSSLISECKRIEYCFAPGHLLVQKWTFPKMGYPK